MLLLLLLLLLPTGDQTVIVEIEFKKEEVHGLRQHVGVHNGQAQVHPRHRKTLELKRVVALTLEHHLGNFINKL